MHSILSLFIPPVATWFFETFKEPTSPQLASWPVIAKGEDVLLLAPTGSGKTLAAFLYGLNQLYQRGGEGVQILYISPLKALNNDIYHNLERPLKGIEEVAFNMRYPLSPLKRGIRTGDTPPKERQRMIKDPPQILITTPESLFLMLSSKASRILKGVRFIIIDEIHTLFPNKRGAHLALSLARLKHLIGDRKVQQMGLSATMAPLREVAFFLGGEEAPIILDTGQRKALDLKILLPVNNFTSPPKKSIWPSIYQLLLTLISSSGTTLIFVHNRQLAERITANLNQLAKKEVARTHHGSISKEVRQGVEELLRQGEIPCIVTTSTLELGIDVGFIHQVIHVESPKGISQGLQRVGRAGHVIGLTSCGRIIPKSRSDLLEASVVVREMKRGKVEELKAPQNPIDVLAQHLVAMPATKSWLVQDIYQVVKGAYHFSSLPLSDLLSVLEMLSGHGYLDLKPRLYWDRAKGVVTSNPYGLRLAYTRGGTIPDQGYYKVYLGEGGPLLGELDEEFVYERRIGDRFLLGTSSWQIQEIRKELILVSPTKGEAMVPFWRAPQGGRSFQLGKRVGEFLNLVDAYMEENNGSSLLQFLKEECQLEEEGALILFDYLQEGREALHHLPTNNHLVVEEFFDELGDKRILLHSPYGYHFHFLLTLLFKGELEKTLGFGIEALPSDDGLMFYLPRHIDFPGFNWDILSDDLEERVAHAITKSNLFGITFRHCAQRSLLLHQGDFKRPNPLWLSRLKAGQLLERVRKYPNFPLIKETFREILEDYLPLKETQEIFKCIAEKRITISYVKRSLPSPFASSHLFNFKAAYMYKDDTPKGDKGLDPIPLKKMLEGGFRSVFQDEVIAKVVKRVQGLPLTMTKEGVLYYLQKMGDLPYHEINRPFPNQGERGLAILQNLLQEGQAALFYQGEKAFITTPDKLPLYLASLPMVTYRGEIPPATSKGESILEIIKQYARTHGPFTLKELSQHYGISLDVLFKKLSQLVQEGILKEGEFLPTGKGKEYCDGAILQAIHRLSLTFLHQVEPKGEREYTLFLFKWHQLGGGQDLPKVLYQLKDLFLPAQLWEGVILPRRIASFSPGQLDLLISSGQFFWQVKGNPPSFKLAFFPLMEDPDPMQLEGQYIREMPKEEISLTPGAQEVHQLLATLGALSIPKILVELKIPTQKLWESLQELLFLGLVTNDTLGPIRYLISSGTKGLSQVLSAQILSTMGRWSLLKSLSHGDLYRRVKTLLHRYGIISYPIIKEEGGDFGVLTPVLKQLELLGLVKRGYFIEGLGGIQYALPKGLEYLMEPKTTLLPKYIALAREDPANPSPLFGEKGWVIFKGGNPILYSHGKELKITIPAPLKEEELKGALLELIKTLHPLYPLEKMLLKKINDQDPLDTPLEAILGDLGFERVYQDLVLWPSKRNRLLNH